MLASIFDTCDPRAEILSGDLSLDVFAAKLRLVVEGKAPQVYQDAHAFFANTFPTDGIKTLIREVFGRLNGITSGSPVIRLETSFGGGKTHDEIALWHICKQGRHIQGLERFSDVNVIPDYSVQVAAVDGRDLDPQNGIFHAETGIITYTLWGEIAYQIGGMVGYSLLKGSDTSGISPGTSVLERLMEGKPTVIILDEIARYLRAAKAKLIGNSDLSEQVVAFLFSLMDLAAACNHLVFVYSLASASDTFAEETLDLQELTRASARQERVLSPSTDIEIYNIVKQRIFNRVDAHAAEQAASEYLANYRGSRINLPDGCKDSSYVAALTNSYPFHPELFNLLTKKIASIPEFQKTRGALRLFALVVQDLWNQNRQYIPLIHTHHIPVGLNSDITNELTSKLQRQQMYPPIGADIYNPDGRPAYAQIQDEQWLIAGKPPFSSWVARTIFLHSLTQGLSSGIRQAELNLSLLTPGLEIGFVQKALDQLIKVAWYLDYDPITFISRFKEEPSINKIITEEKEQIGQSQAKEELRNRRDTIFATRHFNLISSPETPTEVDDKPDNIALCLIDFDEATVRSSTDAVPDLVERIFNNTGEAGKFRIYRNRLLFLVANEQELHRAIDLAREYIAIKMILKSQNRLDDLSELQKKELKAREGDRDLGVRVGLTNSYRHLFYATVDLVKAPKGLMHYTLPSQDSSIVKGKNNQQDVILKALKDCTKIRSEEANTFAPAYILQKVWPSGLDSWTTKSFRDEFSKNLNLNLLLDGEVAKLRDTIRRGLQEGQWDLKIGERLYIKTDDSPLTPPETIEFSERMVLYRRGILQPPEPKIIELNAQLMPSTETIKPVRLRWKAKGAVTVQLYQDGGLIAGEFRPSDEYETQIDQTTLFRLVVDYGNGEIQEKETTVKLSSGTNLTVKNGGGIYGVETVETPTIFDYQSPIIELEGTVNSVFNKLMDSCSDRKVKSIESLEIVVSQFVDYRKLGTAIPLLNRFKLHIDQRVTIQVGDQFLRLEYQGSINGFKPFFTPLISLLNAPDVQGNITLKLTIEFQPAILPRGTELNQIQQQLNRNPVDRLNLTAKVNY
ncbi:MAG TPA: AAA family ATPase [Planktothrix sp. UBA8407]|nr:AAA family ATPase [Planktothrix sp. UBA8407]